MSIVLIIFSVLVVWGGVSQGLQEHEYRRERVDC